MILDCVIICVIDEKVASEAHGEDAHKFKDAAN